MTTINDLLAIHNELADTLEQPHINSWKKAKALLEGRIAGMQEEVAGKLDPLGDMVAVSEHLDAAAEDPLAIEVEPGDVVEEAHEEPKGTIGELVKDLLLDAEGFGYEFIVEAVKREFPEAQTSRRSVASTAAALRKKGVDVPTRRKGRPAEEEA